jgi:hypothetical protein
MDDETTGLVKQVAGGMIRHALTTFGGMLVAAGIIDNTEVSAFVGAGMCLAGIAWSWWQKRGQAAIIADLKRFRDMILDEKKGAA